MPPWPSADTAWRNALWRCSPLQCRYAIAPTKKGTKNRCLGAMDGTKQKNIYKEQTFFLEKAVV